MVVVTDTQPYNELLRFLNGVLSTASLLYYLILHSTGDFCISTFVSFDMYSSVFAVLYRKLQWIAPNTTSATS